MSRRFALEWPGRQRSLTRLALLFAITAGGFWPIWVAQVVPARDADVRATRGRVALIAAALVPGVNLVFEILLALLLPRAVRAMVERDPEAGPAETEAQTFLLLAAPAAAIALALAIGLPAWLVGYLAWPLELPAALVVQRALNRLSPPARPPARRRDGELLAS